MNEPSKKIQLEIRFVNVINMAYLLIIVITFGKIDSDLKHNIECFHLSQDTLNRF